MATATAALSGVKKTDSQAEGKVEGFENLAPKPEPDVHG